MKLSIASWIIEISPLGVIFVLGALLVFYMLFLHPIVRIIQKAGFSGWNALWLFVPGANVLALWHFAYRPWPASQQNAVARRGKATASVKAEGMIRPEKSNIVRNAPSFAPAARRVTLRQLMVGIATWSAVLAVTALIAIAVIDYFFPDLAYTLASRITPGDYPIGTPDAATGKFAISRPYTLPGTPPPARPPFDPYPVDGMSTSR